MSLPDWVGSASAVLTTVAFVPQIWKIWKARAARDISLPMYLLFSAGVTGWIAYGILLGAWPVIVANGITLVLSLAVIAMKWKWDKVS